MTTNKQRRQRGIRSSAPPLTPSNAELEEKLEAFERKFDERFRLAFDAIRKLRGRLGRRLPKRTGRGRLRG